MMNTETHGEYELRPSRQAQALARRMFAQKEREIERTGYQVRGLSKVTRQDEQDLEREARRQARQAADELFQDTDADLDFTGMQKSWEAGKSVASIARLYGVDPSEVGLIAWTKGWRRRPGTATTGPSSLSVRLIELLLSNEVEPAELGLLFHVSPERVSAILGQWLALAPELRLRPRRGR